MSATIAIVFATLWASPSANEPPPPAELPPLVEVVQKFRCPRGLKKRGAPPPKGAAEWCENRRGTRTGPWRSYWRETKAVMDDGQFEKGKHHGEWRSYYPDGKLWRVEVYEMGVEVGIWREWDENGELVNERDFGAAS